MSTLAQLEAKCRKWNDAHPIGTKVEYRTDTGGRFGTTTRSIASVLSGHTAVIWLADKSGCVDLDRVSPISAPPLQPNTEGPVNG